MDHPFVWMHSSIPSKKQWVEAVPIDYTVDNKEQVRIIEQDIKSIKSEIQAQEIQ